MSRWEPTGVTLLSKKKRFISVSICEPERGSQDEEQVADVMMVEA